MRPEESFDRDLRAALRSAPPASGCPADERWADLLRGDLGGDQAEALRRHLEECSRCGQVAADAVRFLAAMAEPGERRRAHDLARWSIAAAAVAAVALGILFGWRARHPAGGGAVARLAASLEVPAPAEADPGAVDSELIFRGGASPEAVAARRDALAPYRERRWEAACDALAGQGRRYPEDREARYLAAVACIKAGDYDRADRLLASLAAVAGDRREAAQRLLERLRRARRGGSG